MSYKYFENGSVSLESFYKNGLKDGITKDYFESGELSWETLYKNGLAINSKQYFKGGKLRAEVEYKNGKAFSGEIYTFEGQKSKMTNAHFNNLGLEY
jgi:antitoxin component YwqK of YwqJK toxin-antitoxin module